MALRTSPAQHSSTPTAGRHAGVDGRFAFIVVAVLSAISAVGALPLISLEETRDWHTFADAAARLLAGQSLYVVDGQVVNLYPPAMAVLWAIGLTGGAWLLFGLIGVAGIGAMGRGIERPALVLLALLQVPVLYDLLLGNVTVLYAGAIAAVLALGGWVGAIPLGVVIAIAAKPAIVPFLVALLVVRRAAGLRVVAVAGVVTGASAVIAGPGAYVDYLGALVASPSILSGYVNGNLGLSTSGSLAVAIGVLAGAGLTLVALRRLPPDLALVVALGASVLVQPTLGLQYGTLLIPAVVLLWRADRLGALVAAVAGVPLTVAFSPVLGGAVILALAFAAPVAGRVPAGWLPRWLVPSPPAPLRSGDSR